MGRNTNSERRMEFTFFLLSVPFHWRKAKYISLYSSSSSFWKNDIRFKTPMPHYKLLLDSTTDHDHFLTCIISRNQQTQRLVLLTTRLDKLHTPPQLRNITVHHVDNYYNNDLLSVPPTTNTTLILEACITNQTSIGWGHYIIGRLTSSFHSVINQYCRTNKLGR